MIDHLNYDVTDDGQHTKIVASPENLIDASVIVGSKKSINPLLYQGTGLVVDPENPLVLPLLTADSTAYSYIPEQPIKEVNQIHKFLICSSIFYFSMVLVSSCNWKKYCFNRWFTSKKQRESCF